MGDSSPHPLPVMLLVRSSVWGERAHDQREVVARNFSVFQGASTSPVPQVTHHKALQYIPMTFDFRIDSQTYKLLPEYLK